MKKKVLIISIASVSIAIVFLAVYLQSNKSDSHQAFQYPKVPESYEKKASESFGLKYEKYYEILNSDTSDFVLNWVKSQNEFTYNFIQNLPNYDNINQAIRRYSNFRRFEYAKRDGGLYVFSEEDPRNNQHKVFYSKVTHYEPIEIFNTNEFYPQSNFTFKRAAPSLNSKYLAILSQNEEINKAEIVVIDLESANGKLKPLRIKAAVNSGLCWNDLGLFYNSPDSAGADKNAVWFLNIFENANASKLIYSNSAISTYQKYPNISQDKKYFLVNSYLEGEGSDICYSEISSGDEMKFKSIVSQSKYIYRFIEKVGNSMYFLTNENAPNKKVVRFDLSSNASKFIVAIPEDSLLLQRVAYNQGRFIALYSDNFFGVVKLFDSTGTFIEKGEIPSESIITGLRGKSKDSDLLFISSTVNTPNEIMKFDALKNRYTSLEKPRTNFNPNNYLVNNISLKVSGNRRLKVILTHKRDLTMDGTNPVFLWSNSIENLTSIPGFGYGKINFMERGGVYVVTNIMQGYDFKKSNFKNLMEFVKSASSDLATVIKYLINNKFTNSDKISAGSTGLGALILANTAIENPNLIKCLFFIDGLFDLTILKNKNEVNKQLISLLGQPNDSTEFRMCLNNSPIYKLTKAEAFPASYIEHVFYNKLIPPINSFRLAAMLQNKAHFKTPFLLSVNNITSSLPLDQDITLRSRRWSFVEHHLKMQ